MATDLMIHTKGLTKRYEDFVAVDRISFDVHRGEVVGFLGPNGAGKSTTMRILTCFISATDGIAQVHGFDVFEEPLEVRKRIGYLPQRAPLYPEMTVHEYLDFCGDLRQLPVGEDRKKAVRRVVEVCGLRSFYTKEIRTLSHGQRQRVGLGQSLLHDPPLLILDEPTADLDPNEKREFLTYLREIGEARTVILSTHNISEVEFACSRTLIISNKDGKGGRIVADGPIETIRAGGGTVRYRLAAGGASGAKGPAFKDLRDALGAVKGPESIREITTADPNATRVEVVGSKDSDLRRELRDAVTAKGWDLLELSRELPPLEDVFRELTLSEDRRDRRAA
ncbi:MAG: ATP-binding cassette domain-containing protein [Deltaproteobacteria bacterium]|nr:ATP-binding cassette domain-containing protein [Deltaproteobacteria bacterium]